MIFDSSKQATRAALREAGKFDIGQVTGEVTYEALAGIGRPPAKLNTLARAPHRGESALGARLAQARETTLDNTVTAAPRVDLIHPGVLRYLREIKLVQ